MNDHLADRPPSLSGSSIQQTIQAEYQSEGKNRIGGEIGDNRMS